MKTWRVDLDSDAEYKDTRVVYIRAETREELERRVFDLVVVGCEEVDTKTLETLGTPD